MLHIIIQARMTSTRLPGKVLLPLCQTSVLEVMLQRLSMFRDNIIIASTNDGSEQGIIELCEKLSIRYFRGDKDNVLARYYHTAEAFAAKNDDVIVRLTSDCPLIDVEVVQACIQYYQQNQYDYVSANTDTGFPRGLDTEVFSFALLKQAYNNAKTPYQQEHVTPYFYQSNGHYRLGQYKNTQDHSQYRLTLDELADYHVIEAIYHHFNCRTDFSYDELIQLLCDNDYIYQLNSAVKQK